MLPARHILRNHPPTPGASDSDFRSQASPNPPSRCVTGFYMINFHASYLGYPLRQAPAALHVKFSYADPTNSNFMSSLTPASSNPFHVLFLHSIAVYIPARYLRSRLRQVPIALQLCKNIPSIIVFAFRLIVVPPPVSILRGFVDSNGALAFMLPSCDIALQLCAHIPRICIPPCS